MDLLTQITLRGTYATLVPLSIEHCQSLIEAAADGELWKIWYTSIPNPANMMKEIEHRLNLHKQGSMLPFTVIDNITGQPIGMTTFHKIDTINNRFDLGWTWYRKSSQRTAINTECKLMLLNHAFENLRCIAVTITANQFNIKSRTAIERLGAKLDGVLRNYKRQNGIVCDYYQYSIIDSEWPRIKIHLNDKLNNRNQ